MPNRYPATFTVPKGAPSSTCHGCQAVIYWIRTPRGKNMPVDTNVEGGEAPTSERDGRGVSHFATCPKAKDYRRARVARGQSTSQR